MEKRISKCKTLRSALISGMYLKINAFDILKYTISTISDYRMLIYNTDDLF